MEKMEQVNILKKIEEESALKQLNDKLDAYEKTHLVNQVNQVNSVNIIDTTNTTNTTNMTNTFNTKNQKKSSDKQSIQLSKSTKPLKLSNKKKVITQNKKPSVWLDEQLNTIREMTYKTFDIKVFNDVQKVIGLKTIE